MHSRRRIAIYLQDTNATFYKVTYYTIQVSWETFTSLYCKFNQENTYQTLSKSASFC